MPKLLFNGAKFFEIEKQIIDSGLGEDKDSFETIKKRLLKPVVLNANNFAEEAVYVILAGGFRQKIAKRKFAEIMEYIYSGKKISEGNLLKIFGNVNKIRAIIKIWNNRETFRNGYYALKNDEERLAYLETLPHIGNITKNHLARNLGLNYVKYDIWIQRLAIAISGKSNLQPNFPLTPELKKTCDDMFATLEKETKLNRGYIDVVLWKACQTGIIKLN